MLDRGEIDAAYGFAPRHDPKLFKLNIDRYGGTPLEGNPRLEKLFADGGRSVIEAFFKRPAWFRPITSSSRNDDCCKENSWLAGELYKIFDASKQAAYERTNFGSPAYLYFESNDRQTQAKTFGDDPFPFGLSKNRPMLEMLFCQLARRRLNAQTRPDRRSFFLLCWTRRTERGGVFMANSISAVDADGHLEEQPSIGATAYPTTTRAGRPKKTERQRSTTNHHRRQSVAPAPPAGIGVGGPYSRPHPRRPGMTDQSCGWLTWTARISQSPCSSALDLPARSRRWKTPSLATALARRA